MNAIFTLRQALCPVLLLAALALAGCGATVVAERPCPAVSELAPALQRQAAEELAGLLPGSALARMLDVLASDRAYNRAICGR